MVCKIFSGMVMLAVDIGNTSITIGLFEGRVLKGRHRIPTHPAKTSLAYRNEIERFLSREGAVIPLDGAILSSVVPEREGVLSRSLKGLSRREPAVLTVSSNTGLSFEVKNPGEIGSDRVADAVAAKEIFGDPVAVADFGTATTISAVRDGRFIGGAILPGMGLMADALRAGTSKLPFVDISTGPPGELHTRAVGKDSTECIVSGIIYGTAGAVERILGEMEGEEGCAFGVVLTGGYAEAIARFLRRRVLLEPDLTLKGLRIIYERNS